MQLSDNLSIYTPNKKHITSPSRLNHIAYFVRQTAQKTKDIQLTFHRRRIKQANIHIFRTYTQAGSSIFNNKKNNKRLKQLNDY